jgi:transposase
VGTLSKLRRMVLRENVSVREAARRLRISRNTAKRWLTEPEMVEPSYPKRVAAERLIDAYTESLQLWIKADRQRGKRERRTVKAYYEAIRAMGYNGAPTPRSTFTAAPSSNPWTTPPGTPGLYR